MEKEVFLTFDDGPNEYTLKILEGLKKFDAWATFFVCGKNCQKFPEIAKKIINDGQGIGNHTFSHSIDFLFPWNFKKEIEKTKKIVQDITKKETKIFRPPWGILTPWLKRSLFENDYQIILWDIDSKDWKNEPANLIEEEIFKKIKSGSIILFHDCLQTSLALPKILEELKKKDYVFKKF
jgi:peptidoglycan/xylan/chitin deacetylase (PgdA/CDA1 family)